MDYETEQYLWSYFGIPSLLVKLITSTAYIPTRLFLRVLMGKKRRNKFMTEKFGWAHSHEFIWWCLRKLPKSTISCIQIILLTSKQTYEKDVSMFLSELKGEVFVDVGAHVGRYSLLLHKNFKRIFAFEPYHKNMERLKYNVQLAKAKNVTCIQMAVCDKDGESILYLSSHSGGHTLKSGGDNGILVRTCSLASFLEAEPRIDLVKVDVESAEWEVLGGAEPAFERIRSWVVELHDITRKKEVEKLFHSRGCSTQWLDFNHIYAWREVD